jgi:c-type cytochrome biogenesis protein CcmF
LKLQIANFEQGLLAAVFILCALATVSALAALKPDLERARKVFLWARRFFIFAVALSILALMLFTVAFVMDDFSIAAVAQYSSTKLPFFYKLSAVWAGSAGSLLLWTVGVFLLFLFWMVGCKTQDPAFNAAALSIGAGVCLGFSALLTFVARPFAAAEFLVEDGMGLNPLLQNFWMVIHPPLLFIGYSAFLVPFVIAVSCAFARRFDDTAIYKQLRWWLLFGICFLSLGIATGARWSYVELGWGGYWAWDPVENASLLPWLMAIAGLHSIAGMRAADKFRRWTLVLAPVPFVLCLVATFITRSGFLSSVHSFGDSPMALALLFFIGFCVLLWLASGICAAWSISVVPSRKGAFHLDKAEIMSWAVATLILAAVIIGAATFCPVIWKVIRKSESAFTPTSVFYNYVISIAGILWAFLVGLASLSDLSRGRQRFIFAMKVLLCCAIALVCFGILFRLAGEKPLMSLACAICAFSAAGVFFKLLHRLQIRARVVSEIAHLGLLLLVVTAGFSWREQSIQTPLAKGGKITLSGYEFIYDSFEHKLSGDITRVGPQIVVRKENFQRKLWPHSNLYSSIQRESSSTSEVAVYTRLLEDIYVSFDGIGQSGGVIITAKIKPFVLWLWLAAILIIAGVAGAMLKARKKQSAKAEELKSPPKETGS